MRSLIKNEETPQMSAATVKSVKSGDILTGALKYEQTLAGLKARYHSQCFFNRQTSIVPELRFLFDDAGTFHGSFNCNALQQGYDDMVHGGVIAAVIDASMVQCLMGHGIIGYTANLSIRYRRPVKIRTLTKLKTSIVSVKYRDLYSMSCRITQGEVLVVKADGTFFRTKQCMLSGAALPDSAIN